MKQTIEIDVPDGKKAVWKNGNIVFEDALPKTWQEFCNTHKIKGGEFCINKYSNILCLSENNKRDIDYSRNNLPSIEAAQAHRALMQLHQLRDCYRQGWKPNLVNKEPVWAINWDIDILEVRILIPGDSRFLSFNSQELAEQFLNNFRDIIKIAGDLI